MFWVSILGGHRTPSGPWRPDRTNVAVSAVAGQRLDFTQARLDEGETRVYVVVLMGATQVIVPRTGHCASTTLAAPLGSPASLCPSPAATRAYGSPRSRSRRSSCPGRAGGRSASLSAS